MTADSVNQNNQIPADWAWFTIALFIASLLFFGLFLYTICSHKIDNPWRTIISVISIIVSLISLLTSIISFILIAMGLGLAVHHTAPKMAWEEARTYNRTAEEWDSLSDKEKENRIGCIEVIEGDCGGIVSREEIIKYLKGEDSEVHLMLSEDDITALKKDLDSTATSSSEGKE